MDNNVKKTNKYEYLSYPASEDVNGFYFSENVMDAFLDKIKPVVLGLFNSHLNISKNKEDFPDLNIHRIWIRKPKIELEDSFNLVINAFTNFSPELGEMAKQIISDKKRWNLFKTDSGNANGYCHLANCEGNEKEYAIINYSYDETINDVIYIAHEMGHLIADDYRYKANENISNKDHMNEVQAFMAQHIIYDFLINNENDNIREAGKSHYIAEITRMSYDIILGVSSLEVENNIHQNIKNPFDSFTKVLNEFLGDKWSLFQKAEYLSDNIENFNIRDSEGISKLHTHPMASMISQGLFLEINNLDKDQRINSLKKIWGFNGKLSLDQVLDLPNINKNGIAKIADNAVEYMCNLSKNVFGSLNSKFINKQEITSQNEKKLNLRIDS